MTTPTTPEIIPCPFCADPMRLSFDVLRHDGQAAGCPIGSYAWGGDDAVARWNQRARPVPDPLPDPSPEIENLLLAAWDEAQTEIDYALIDAAREQRLEVLRRIADKLGAWIAREAAEVPDP